MIPVGDTKKTKTHRHKKLDGALRVNEIHV